MLYLGHVFFFWGGVSYHSAEIQSVYSTAPANLAVYAKRLGNCIHCTFIFTSFCVVFFSKSFFFLHTVILLYNHNEGMIDHKEGMIRQ